jgi:HD superfamily phosphohydrolase
MEDGRFTYYRDLYIPIPFTHISQSLPLEEIKRRDLDLKGIQAEFEVRDSIHGLVKITEEEKKIVDTSVFQRLRRIRQLAMTELVYPSATHTRFEHSLGTLYISGRLAGNLDLDEDSIRLVRLAALLHDIGHGPFSHVSEQVISSRASDSVLTNEGAIHEQIGADIVKNNDEISHILDQKTRKWVASVLSKEIPQSVERDLVTGPADADKMDYLIRDSHCCGVRYGYFDLEWILHTARVIQDANTTRLGFDREAVWALNQLVLAYHNMHRQVYCHKTRLGTDIMLVRSLQLALDSGVIESAGFVFRETKRFREAFLSWDDYSILHEITISKKVCGRLMKMLVKRKLPKLIYKENLDKFGEGRLEGTFLQDYVMNPEEFGEKQIAHAEAEMADRVETEHWKIFLNIESEAFPTYWTPGYRIDDESIMVTDDIEGPRMFNKISTIFREGARTPMMPHIEIYLLDAPSQKEERKEIGEKMKEVLLDVIEEQRRTQ